MPAQTVLRFRRGTAAAWTSANPILESGEAGFETDTFRVKVGNGSTAWNSLAYIAAGSATTATTATNVAGGATGSLPYQTGAGATAQLAIGTAGRVLTVNAGGTAPEWSQPKLNAFAATTSAELAGVISDETGTGSLVFSTSPSLTTPSIGSGGANFSGSTSGTTNLRASSTASGTLTLPAETGTLATQAWATGQFVDVAGDTMSGALAMGGNNISGVGELTATGVTGTTVTATTLRAGGTGYIKAAGTGAAATTSATVPVADISGTLPVANGGTGASSLASGYLKGNGTGAVTSSATIPYTDIPVADRNNSAFGAGSVFNRGNASTNTNIFVTNTTTAPSALQAGDLWFY